MAQKIKPYKTKDPDPAPFIETVKFELLACGNVSDNNNKFYCMELQKDPIAGEYRLFTHYGRIQKTNVYEIRDSIDGEKVTDVNLSVLEKEYNRILKAKKRPKKGKANYETVDTQEPTVGSTNIRGKTNTTSTARSSKGDLSILKLFDSDVVKTMVKRVWEENIHNITNLTTMNVTSSGIASPLGPLTLTHIEDSLRVLNHIKQCYSTICEYDVLTALNSKYFSMIPHPFGSRIPKDALIDDDKKFMTEYDLLEQMKAAIKTGGEEATDEQLEDIGFEIQLLDSNSAVWDAIETQYRTSRARCHSQLNGWNVKNIFEMSHKGSTDNYDKLDDRFKTDEFDLYHGSRACNILSIMINGLMVPPKTAGHVTGRMFGDGIYAASASTKALNYATGYWAGGVRNKHKQAYMFVVKFAMGKMYYPDGAKYDGAPTGYDSIWAKRDKTRLANDEFIVYRTDQAKITHLLQLEETY